MAKRNYKPEENVLKFRQAAVLLAQSTKVPDVVCTLGVTQVTYYRRQREYGGLQIDQVKRMTKPTFDCQSSHWRRVEEQKSPHTFQGAA